MRHHHSLAQAFAALAVLTGFLTCPLSAGDASDEFRWGELMRFSGPLATQAKEPTKDAPSLARGGSKVNAGAEFRARAEAWRVFREEFPNSRHGPEARQREASDRLKSALAGDTSQAATGLALVDAVRDDTAVSATRRAELAVLADIVRLRALAGNREKFLAAHEAAARAVIQAFPSEPAGYVALLRAAEASDDNVRLRAIARELTESGPPSEIVTRAQRHLRRLGLHGRSLTEILRAAGRTDLAAQLEHRAVIVCAIGGPPSGALALGQALAEMHAPEVLLVALNSGAAGVPFPCLEIDDTGGPLAEALGLSSGTALATDRQGRIRELAAHQGAIAVKLAAVLREEGSR